MKFSKKKISSTILAFTQSHSSLLNDPPKRYFQKNSGTYEIEKLMNLTGIDEIHFNCECINGSNVNGVREPVLFSFALKNPPGQKIYKELWINLFEKINIAVLSDITFCLEDDEYKAVDFKGETLTFTCHLVKKFNEILWMILDVFIPKSETEDLLLSITKNCENLNKQAHKEPQETFEFKLTEPKETFSFIPSIILGVDSKLIVSFTSLEVYNFLIQ